MPESATPGQIIASLVVITLFVASLVLGIRTLVRAWQGETLVPYESRSQPKFTWVELVLTIVSYVVFSGIAYVVLTEGFGLRLEGELNSLPPDEFLILMIVNSLATLLAGVVLLMMIPLRQGGRFSDLGITLKQATADLKLGAGAFLLMGGLVYLMQTILYQIFPEQHPLLEMISLNPQLEYFAGAFLSAAIVAPVIEELLFRAAVQGWLEKFFLFDSSLGWAVGSPKQPIAAEVLEAEVIETPVDSEQVSDNPYVSPRATSDVKAPDTDIDSAPETIAWPPIVISSFLFAIMHFGQGPAPIPLFFLALCLGYLYQKTHRLLPCITLHALLNTTSIVMLWLSVAA